MLLNLAKTTGLIGSRARTTNQGMIWKSLSICQQR